MGTKNTVIEVGGDGRKPFEKIEVDKPTPDTKHGEINPEDVAKPVDNPDDVADGKVVGKEGEASGEGGDVSKPGGEVQADKADTKDKKPNVYSTLGKFLK